MEQVLKVFFKSEATFYSAFVTIVHQNGTDFIFVEFLDDDMIDNFNGSHLSYVGERGYVKLDYYQSVYLRPILSNLAHIIKGVLQIGNAKIDTILDEDYIRQN